MNKKIQLIYLILIFTLIFSCVEKKSTHKETNAIELLVTAKTDTLKFKSGIRAVFQDSKGNYWLGSHSEGVCFYNGKWFTYFTTNEGLADNQIRSIQEDKYGNIWFGTAKGVSSFDGMGIKNYPANENSETEWAKTDNDLWFNAGTKQGVYKYDGQNVNYLAFPSPKVTNSGNVFAVTDISKGKNNMIWFGTFAGVFGYNGKEFTIINDETLGLTIDAEPLHIRSILEDSKGRLWIGNNGIGVLLKEGDAIINFSDKNNLIHPRSGRKGDKSMPGTLEHVFTIAEDSKGNIWFGDRDSGAWKYDGKTLTNYTIDTKLNSQMIWSIYEDQNKNVLFGMAEGGVYSFNGKTFEKQF